MNGNGKDHKVDYSVLCCFFVTFICDIYLLFVSFFFGLCNRNIHKCDKKSRTKGYLKVTMREGSRMWLIFTGSFNDWLVLAVFVDMLAYRKFML